MDEAQKIISKKMQQMDSRQPRASAVRRSTHHQQVNECNSEDEHDRSEESDEAKEIRTRRTHNRGRTERSENIHTFGKNTARLSQNEYLQDQLREEEDDEEDQEEVSGLSYDDEEDSDCQESSKNDETFEVDNRQR